MVSVGTGGSFSQTFVVASVLNPDTPPPNHIYQIDGANRPTLTLRRGGVYTFDQSAASNSNHPIVFRDSANNSWTSGVVSIGTPGTVGAQTVFSVPSDAPQNLRYSCTVHGNGMGNTITVLNFGIIDTTGGVSITLSSAMTANAEGIYTFTSTGNDAGALVPYDLRYDIWRVQFTGQSSDPLIKLVHYQDVSIDQKVYIRYGIGNANKEYFKDYDGFFYQTPLLSSLLDTLYTQDGVDAGINKSVKIVDYAAWNIDVEEDILGQQTYTSPNGVEFTSGLKIRFLGDVTSSQYQNKEFYVEAVGSLGSGIRLVPVDELVTPELYNDENALNYPDQVFPDYITIVRSSVDRNAWSRNNRWFHREVISKTAEYLSIEAGYYIAPLFDQKLRAQRPIVQFESDIQLFNNGRIAKYPVDILDTTTKDAFV